MISLASLAVSIVAATAQDWATYRGDNARSGKATTELTLPLAAAWTFRAPHPPSPAWPGPARRDAYNRVEELTPRLGFDRAFHVIAAGDNAWFANSADDQVYCLDLATGTLRWTAFAEGPIRIAPSFHDGRVYFGADDGAVYCVDASTGDEIWKRRVAPIDRRVPGNGRMMSVWPVRSGVVIAGGIAYCAAGLFPTEQSYLAAFRASDGEPLWRTAAADVHPQGPMLASRSSLYVPTGRGRPVVFARENGRRLRTLGGAGGTFCILDGDSLIYGPGKNGQLGEFDGSDQIATFEGLHILVEGDHAYLHTEHELSALNRTRYNRLLAERRALEAERKRVSEALSPKAETGPADRRALRRRLAEIGREVARLNDELPKCVRWRQPDTRTLDVILCGEVLIDGGSGRVTARSTTTGEPLWRAAVEGAALGLCAARGRLLVSTDAGTIHCFAEGGR